MRFMTYNLLDYGLSQESSAFARCERVHEVIRLAGPDILAVQELIADHPDPATKSDLAGQRLRQLAEAVGLECDVEPGQLAVAVGNHRFHVALLWRSGITPVGGWRALAGVNVWHSMAALTFDVGAHELVRHAAFHATPFGRHRRADECERVVSVMTRPDGRPPGVIGADWNCVSADRVLEHGWVSEDDAMEDRWVYYDQDPYAGPDKRWHDDLVYQTRWEYDHNGRRRWWADREPGEVLYAGGLRDVAAALDAPWQTTVGHWPEGDPFGPRRIDAVRVTSELVPALRHYEVVDTELALSASDHLPVVVEYDPAKIETTPPAATL